MGLRRAGLSLGGQSPAHQELLGPGQCESEDSLLKRDPMEDFQIFCLQREIWLTYFQASVTLIFKISSPRVEGRERMDLNASCPIAHPLPLEFHHL